MGFVVFHRETTRACGALRIRRYGVCRPPFCPSAPKCPDKTAGLLNRRFVHGNTISWTKRRFKLPLFCLDKTAPRLNRCFVHSVFVCVKLVFYHYVFHPIPQFFSVMSKCLIYRFSEYFISNS
jgi:hypothetical protein